MKISIQALELISYNLSYFDCFTIIQTFDLTFCFTVSHERLWHEKEVYHENWSTYVSTITSNFVLIIGTFGIPFTLTFWGYIFESVTAKNELNCGIQAIIFVTNFRNDWITFDSKLYHLMSVSINWFIGYINIFDGCWRQNVMMSNCRRYKWPIQDLGDR